MMTRLTLLAAAVAGCAPAAVPPSSAEIPMSAVHISSSAELGLPLQQAFSAWLAQGGAEPFEVVFAEGTYTGPAISLKDPRGQGAGIILRPAEGAAVTLQVPVALSARSLTVSDLIFADIQDTEAIVDLRFAEQATVRRVSLVDNTLRSDEDAEAPLIRLTGGFRSRRAAAVLSESWLVGNRVASGPLIAMAGTGADKPAALTLQTVSVVGNQAEGVLDPGFTAAVTVTGSTLDSEAPLLRIRSPLPRISITDSALSTTSDLSFIESPDVQLGAFPAVTIADSTVALPPTLILTKAAMSTSRRTDRSPDPASVSSARAAARSGTPPAQP